MTALWMLLAIVCEVGWALRMKSVSGLTRYGITIEAAVLYILSLVFLSLATRKMEIGTAYAVWAGSGVALIAIGGIFIFGESAGPAKLICLALIFAGVVGLNLTTAGH